ncbi:hypothetical protein HETIRDRAFT_442294 [Heterobasidion irregulare TC 32-1]|uniref:Uncharacterized protein n=1 Tax=Heterobasidion irregulare (strain TC 32-1) TaxID=747525 RepID=W4JSN2_HETIT|nr:uncharacterized protein HETIRDRAFT_442294 [Heterobasidion irregulare TC 32-1]ETW75866.1 hypothetical protein HETIRDRAFT_442294 [Heterobasidion irregulare TC 32-1]
MKTGELRRRLSARPAEEKKRVGRVCVCVCMCMQACTTARKGGRHGEVRFGTVGRRCSKVFVSGRANG